MLVKYIRDNAKRPIGCVVAVAPDAVGWSVCHPNDEFDKRRAVEIARGRAERGSISLPPEYRSVWQFTENDLVKVSLYSVVEAEMEAMSERASRYFKN